MSGAAGAASGAAAAAAAIANAIKASGAIVQIEPADFEGLVERIAAPLVLHQKAGGMFARNHQYATSYRGFVFFTSTPAELYLPEHAELLPVKKIWMPS